MITWVQFLGDCPPLEFGRAKTVQNLVRFCATSHYDRKYLRNGGSYRQAENGVINSDHSHVRRRKFGEDWSTNKKVIGAHVDPPNVILRKTTFRRLFPSHSFPSLPECLLLLLQVKVQTSITWSITDVQASKVSSRLVIHDLP